MAQRIEDERHSPAAMAMPTTKTTSMLDEAIPIRGLLLPNIPKRPVIAMGQRVNLPLAQSI